MTNTELRELIDALLVVKGAPLTGWARETIDDAAAELARLSEENEQLRAERDALLQKPLDMAKMDSIDEGVPDKMVAYYWWEQAQEARAALSVSQQG